MSKWTLFNHWQTTISREIADSLNEALAAMETAVNDVQAVGGLSPFMTKVRHDCICMYAVAQKW